MFRLLVYVWLLAAVRLGIALDIAVASGPNLVNNATQGRIIMNGIWYSRSNSTTDVNAMDPLLDAEACTRDAALMSELGINTIYVMAIDAKENHDDCFSIFNSVGIYVMLVLRKDGIFSTTASDFVKSYNTDFLKDMFEMIDAVKDYDNMLGFDLGVFPHMGEFALGTVDVSYVDAEKMYRSFIRDIKEYIYHNAPRSILVGGTLYLTRSDEGLGPSDLTHGHTYWLSCAVDGKRDEFSRADYVAFWNLGYFEEDPVGDQNFTYASLEESLTDAFVPTWLSMYGVSDEADLVEYELRPELLNDTLFLYNSSSELIAPRGAFSGGARFTWTNANLGWKSPISNWGIVTTDSEGNVQLTENYDRLREIFSDMNTENWLSGESVPEYNIPACKKEDMVNTTTEMYIDDATTMTIATDWQLPTRPAGLDALITSGVSGTRGQMVDVTITTIVHTVRDSQGNVVTNLALSPSKSESRTTTGAPEETNIINPPVTPESGLSTGAKAGIGAGAAVAGLAVIGAAGFFLLRRHRNSKAAKAAKEDEIQLSDHDSKGGFHKAELATGDEVERKHAELAAQDGKTPQEVAAMEAGGGIFEMNAGSPVELPAHEQTLELPAQSRGEEAQNPRRD